MSNREAAAASERPDLHAAIMNLPCNVPPGYPFGSKLCAGVYRQGHRDARHAAAELAVTSQLAQPAAPADEQIRAEYERRASEILAAGLSWPFEREWFAAGARFALLAAGAPQAVRITQLESLLRQARDVLNETVPDWRSPNEALHRMGACLGAIDAALAPLAPQDTTHIEYGGSHGPSRF